LIYKIKSKRTTGAEGLYLLNVDEYEEKKGMTSIVLIIPKLIQTKKVKKYFSIF